MKKKNHYLQEQLYITKRIFEGIDKKRLDSLPDLMRVLVNEAMRIERENYLNDKSYERTEGRWDMLMVNAKHASGKLTLT